LGPLDECGIWTVHRAGNPPDDPALAELAVNLANAAESDLRPPADRLAQDRNEPVLAGWLSRPLWFYLLAAACALTVTEWFLYQRRFIT
jgi:hypothetical protein